MRPFFRSLLAPLAVAALALLPACSSSKSAQQPASTTTAQTRGDADVMVPAGQGATASNAQGGPGAQRGPGQIRMEGGPGGEFRNMTPEQRVERRLAQLDEALTLSAEQKTQIRPILIVEAENPTRMRREDMQNASPEEIQAMVQGVMRQAQERRDRINALIEAKLTAEQLPRFRAFVQQERERMQQGRRMIMGGNGQ